MAIALRSSYKKNWPLCFIESAIILIFSEYIVPINVDVHTVLY